MSVAAVLLAAGAGERFEGDGPKLRALLGGRCLLEWAVEAAIGAELDDTMVVVGSDDFRDLLPKQVRVVVNERWADGQAGSLLRAVEAAEELGHESVVVAVADQPFVPSSCWRLLARPGVTPIVSARFAGKRRPPVRLDREVWRLLPRSGEAGARVLFESHPELVSEVDCSGDPRDVDTVDALAEAEQRLADVEAVTGLLGRAPMGHFDVVVRDDAGLPVVLRNHPLLYDGTPMPTLFWLCGAREQVLVGRLESSGGVRRAEAEVGLDAIAAAHDRYRAERDAALPDGSDGHRPSGGVGGTRTGVKCLHAHYAWFLAGGDDPVGRWVEDHLAEVDRDDWPAPAELGEGGAP